MSTSSSLQKQSSGACPQLLRSNSARCLALQELCFASLMLLACLPPAQAMVCSDNSHLWVVTSLWTVQHLNSQYTMPAQDASLTGAEAQHLGLSPASQQQVYL